MSAGLCSDRRANTRQREFRRDALFNRANTDVMGVQLTGFQTYRVRK
jgi:hypothetical protein